MEVDDAAATGRCEHTLTDGACPGQPPVFWVDVPKHDAIEPRDECGARRRPVPPAIGWAEPGLQRASRHGSPHRRAAEQGTPDVVEPMAAQINVVPAVAPARVSRSRGAARLRRPFGYAETEWEEARPAARLVQCVEDGVPGAGVIAVVEGEGDGRHGEGSAAYDCHSTAIRHAMVNRVETGFHRSQCGPA